ncbi:MAG: DUF3179 domain-containing protein [Candidatus Rokubacteria bacterium]|nr:DUF3179 domain-containing protein [Candidatus Rokubacteria bacterium]
MGTTTYTFGSSGLLFRSNKLMYDHQTNSLWTHMTGEPVVGKLAHGGIRLKVLPVVVTTWKDWRTAHPDTLVLDIKTGYRRDYTPGRPYGRYFASPDTMFPVSPRSERLRPKAEVLAVRIGTARKAFPLEVFGREPVINDRVGTTTVVVVGKPETRTARAYERGPLTFRPGRAADELIEAGTGIPWRVEEERLVNARTGATLPRVGGHLVYWFGWYAFYPDSEVYGPAP